MILGIGNDLIEVHRIQSILQSKRSAKFLQRILTPEEQHLAKQRQKEMATFVAGRFSAKEAVAKALGYGIGEKLRFIDIEILPDPHGKPTVYIHAEARSRCVLRTNFQLHLSISHTARYASAVAIYEQV